MANISYVFTVGPGRANRYRVQFTSIEITSAAYGDMELWMVDTSGNQATEVLIARNDIKLGISIIFGGNVALEFSNPSRKPRNGYFGGVM